MTASTRERIKHIAVTLLGGVFVGLATLNSYAAGMALRASRRSR